jgi:hypothetical protein
MNINQTLFLIIFILLISCKGTANPNLLKDQKVKNMDNADKTEYSIDDREASKGEFEKFLKTLKQIPHTWFCAETTKGGITGYDAEDKNGVKYEYRAYSETGNNKSSIKKKLILH